MVDFFYDFFYEVLSEEGIWVLILIGAAFAVASFILLMMKIETNPKQRKQNTVRTGNVTIEDPVQVKKKKEKKKKNRSKTEEQNEEEEYTVPEVNTAMPVTPQMVRPDDAEQADAEQLEIEPGNMEQTEAMMTDPDGLDIPALPDTEGEASPLNDAPMPSVPAGAPEGTQPEMETSPYAEVEENQPENDSVETVKNEEEKGEEEQKEKTDGGSIFDIFTEVEEEESTISEFAKNLDDVTINGLLTDTEELSEELKNIFTKHRRA